MGARANARFDSKSKLATQNNPMASPNFSSDFSRFRHGRFYQGVFRSGESPAPEGSGPEGGPENGAHGRSGQPSLPVRCPLMDAVPIQAGQRQRDGTARR
jgi:hypothetical protein